MFPSSPPSHNPLSAALTLIGSQKEMACSQQSQPGVCGHYRGPVQMSYPLNFPRCPFLKSLLNLLLLFSSFLTNSTLILLYFHAHLHLCLCSFVHRVNEDVNLKNKSCSLSQEIDMSVKHALWRNKVLMRYNGAHLRISSIQRRSQ